ncbi:zinc-binding dehydrogenase [Nonomuraea sp. NPDC048892]|uniref:zinc-binding dehydrogenase n=1 Tax=Nonomuraea sp. NPDC048892 TaxID=3154624 RepID=UPI0033E16E50
MQYARLLGGGATVVAFARSDDKLAVARENGADHTINTRGKTVDQVRAELRELTGREEADGVLDCSGAPESLALNASLLAYEATLVSVGLMGQRVELPLFPFVSGERTFTGSFWGNYHDLTEVLALADRPPGRRLRLTSTAPLPQFGPGRCLPPARPLPCRRPSGSPGGRLR